jgi:hypothetical protein
MSRNNQQQKTMTTTSLDISGSIGTTASTGAITKRTSQDILARPEQQLRPEQFPNGRVKTFLARPEQQL